VRLAAQRSLRKQFLVASSVPDQTASSSEEEVYAMDAQASVA
jgi:hypothetical protein